MKSELLKIVGWFFHLRKGWSSTTFPSFSIPILGSQKNIQVDSGLIVAGVVGKTNNIYLFRTGVGHCWPSSFDHFDLLIWRIDAELKLIILSNPSCSALVCPTKRVWFSPRLIHQTGEIYKTSRVCFNGFWPLKHIQEIQTKSGWWFGTFFMFPYIGNNHPNWLSYFSEGLKPPTRSAILFGIVWFCTLDVNVVCLHPCKPNKESHSEYHDKWFVKTIIKW